MNKFATLRASAAAGLATLGASAFAVGPSAGDLTALVPDSATILTAISAVGVVMIGVTLAIVGFKKIRTFLN